MPQFIILSFDIVEPDAADPYLEDLLAQVERAEASGVCRAHPGTTVGRDGCAMCALDEANFRLAERLSRYVEMS